MKQFQKDIDITVKICFYLFYLFPNWSQLIVVDRTDIPLSIHRYTDLINVKHFAAWVWIDHTMDFEL